MGLVIEDVQGGSLIAVVCMISFPIYRFLPIMSCEGLGFGWVGLGDGVNALKVTKSEIEAVGRLTEGAEMGNVLPKK